MSKSKQGGSGRAVALQYGPGSGAPVIVASGMGHLAERIVEVAVDSGVPVYEDNSLATILSQMELGREIPEGALSGHRGHLHLLFAVRPVRYGALPGRPGTAGGEAGKGVSMR